MDYHFRNSLVKGFKQKGLEGIDLVDFLPVFTRETTFETLAFLHTNFLLKGVHFKRKEFAPLGANVFLLEWTSFQNGGKNDFARVAFRVYYMLVLPCGTSRFL